MQKTASVARLVGAFLAAMVMTPLAWAELPPVKIAVIAEFGMKNSVSAQSIEKGARLAAEEINAAGGVLNGRKLEVITRDDRGMPARAIDHFVEVSKMPELLAVYSGRMSPVALELVPVANKEGVILMGTWGSASGFTSSGAQTDYVFRLSLTDPLATTTMLRYAQSRKLDKLAVFLPNTSWGRSNQAEIEKFAVQNRRLKPEFFVYNWGDKEFTDKLTQARANGAQALVMIANDLEGSLIVKQMAAMPPALRMPIISHWGITGGHFLELVGPALDMVDLSVVQTFTFNNAKTKRTADVARLYQKTYGEPIDKLQAQVGFAHAYDLTHLLAMAINKAGNTKRASVRDALEALPAYDGLIRRYQRPFKPGDHEALDAAQVFMARYRADGTLERIK